MGAGSDAPHLDEYAFRLVACKARQLIGQYGFTEDDQPDIRQDLLADLLHRLPSFDSSRASLSPRRMLSGCPDRWPEFHRSEC